jgi:DNA invertase Pin-like site-specific DNA recombinase
MVRRSTRTATGEASAWGYVRYSTDKQGPNSVERQVARIEEWAKRTGSHLIGIAFDFEVSRTVDHGDRPGLALALDKVGRHGVLVAETTSRLAGDPWILGGIRRELARKGGRVATCDERGNEDLDEDRQDFDALFSKREIKQIRSRTKGALAVKRMRGEVVGVLPFGFGRKADGHHVMDPRTHAPRCKTGCTGCLHVERNDAEQATIARAIELAKTCRIRELTDTLNAEGHRTRRGTPFTFQGVWRMLGKVDAAAE